MSTTIAVNDALWAQVSYADKAEIAATLRSFGLMSADAKIVGSAIAPGLPYSPAGMHGGVTPLGLGIRIPSPGEIVDNVRKEAELAAERIKEEARRAKERADAEFRRLEEQAKAEADRVIDQVEEEAKRAAEKAKKELHEAGNAACKATVDSSAAAAAVALTKS